MKEITIDTIVNSSISKTWNFYTEPQHITQWNFADPSWHCPSASNDMKIGGKYLARMEAKDASFGFDFEAYYTEINEGKNFTYEFGGRKCTVQFEEIGDATKVTISFDPETENPIEMQRTGWQLILNNFKNYTESN
ncbi:MAG: activator of HSP90 ATPase [Flavobacteriales bacterium]|nr:activator of HSP90 ATPase [Flavobacteriales bacterium]